MKNEALNPYVCDGHLVMSEKLIEPIRALYGQEAAKAILFLLHRVEARTRADFLCRFVYKTNLAHEPNVTIIIKPLDRWVTMRGNLGRYMVFVRRSADNERLLRFTNQASLVYYLMYLIDRYHRQPSSSCDSVIPPLKLRKNRVPFMELYQKVYDIDSQKLLKRYQQLLYREDHGHLRVGREAECIYDIRQHLQEAIAGYNESFFPYAMTAHSHLAIGADHICFEGEARSLLELRFL